MSETFYFNKDNLDPKRLSRIGQIVCDMTKQGNVKVVISDKNETRSMKLNRTFNMICGDIAKKTGHGVSYERGRCKDSYFLPIFIAKYRDKKPIEHWTIQMALKNLDYEQRIKFLAADIVPLTSAMNNKDFSECLNEMLNCESHNITRHPDDYRRDL